MRNIVDEWGGLNSVYPCTEYLTFGPWIYMVPQYKPESVLMLGYAGGTTAGLIKKLYGEDVKITAVDNVFVEDEYGVEFIEADAQEYVKDCPHYDCIIVDIYGQELEPPEFIFSKEFADAVSSKCNYLIVDATDNSDMSAYEHLHLVKKLQLNRNIFYYYMINRIARLPIR